MQISTKDWKKYINQMAKISQTAADKMQEWVAKHGFGDNQALLDYAYALATHYGEAIGALSCQMYEATATAQNVTVKPAETAATPEYGEVAKAVNGAKKQSERLVSSTVGRLVKQVGADTTLKNAKRDNAQFAWIPHGDTCAFCLTLASRGWQYMSAKALKGGHAEHIHANCDCQYAIRFDTSSTVEGYDPDKYREMYENAEGNTSQEKINSMRRQLAAEKGITGKRLPKSTDYSMNKTVIDSNEYKRKFNNLTSNTKVNESIHKHARGALYHRDGTNREDLYILSNADGRILGKNITCNEAFGVPANQSIQEAVRNYQGQLIGLHTHPNDTPPTGSDFYTAFARRYEFGVVANSTGTVYKYGVGKNFISSAHIDKTVDKFMSMIDDTGKKVYANATEAHLAALKQLKKDEVIWFETW